jgi:hypothetical protein
MDESIFDSLGAEPFFTNALNSFNLSAADHAEVLSVKTDDRFRYVTELEKLAKTTTNVGVQYLMVGRQETILLALANDNLDPKVIMLLLESTRLITPLARVDRGRRLDVFSIYRALIKNRTVVASMNLFMQTWSAVENFENDMSSKSQESSYVQLLHGALLRHSKESREDKTGISVGTLLFISSRLNIIRTGMILTMAKSLRDAIVETRIDEIRAWIEENMPDYVDFPLSWVYEVFDLHEFDKLVDLQKIGEA